MRKTNQAQNLKRCNSFKRGPFWVETGEPIMLIRKMRLFMLTVIVIMLSGHLAYTAGNKAVKNQADQPSLPVFQHLSLSLKTLEASK
jgi:hypothetical protein